MNLYIEEWVLYSPIAFFVGGIFGYIYNKIFGAAEKTSFWGTFLVGCVFCIIGNGLDFTINLMPLIVCFSFGVKIASDAQYEKENKD